MAEILGLASSIITIVGVAGKLGTSTVRLKRLWDEVQDVPESIKRCIDHLELLAPAIEEMDNEFEQTRHMVQNDSAAKRSLEYSRRAVETLETLVRDMEIQITTSRKRKRFVAQFKVMIKKEVIEAHQRRLDSTLQLVSLSQQTYLIALSRSQSSIMVSELKSWHESERRKIVEQKPDALITTENKHIKQDLISDTSQTSSVSVKRPGNKSIPWHRPGFLGSFFYQSHEVTEHLYAPDDLDKTQVHQLRVQLPQWLMQRAWDLHALRAHHGWTIQLRAWTTRPRKAEIFRLIKDGRTDLVVGAIRNKEASIYDRNSAGYSLIEVATVARQLDVIKALMSMGLSLTDTGHCSLFIELLRWSWVQSDSSLTEFGHILVTVENEAFGYHPYTFALIWSFEGLWESLRSHLSLHWLIDIMLWEHVNPLIPLEMLLRGAVAPETFRNIHGQLGPSLHGFASVYFHTFLNSQAAMEGWRLLARKMFVGATASEASCMNVIGILGGLWRRQFTLQPFETWVRRALGMLLEDLAIAGVDLEEYMRLEAIHSYERGYEGQRIAEDLELRPEMRVPEFGPALVIHATGSMPTDWAFSWDPCVEEVSGEFWSMVGHIEQPIPGAWVDLDPYSKQEQALKSYGCQMKQWLCRTTRRCGSENKFEENKLLRVRGITTCQEVFPVFQRYR
ncbi:hypothetical protein KAF25_011200 [Fusarium avenaceum]|uniref:NACHT-NTPase and P-loop NTPases N-terminal domain-containing protein n=1 Tax=Fusarium avenaceum TaxID=40199 RepID=A0A9P7KS40_9HYPO|nr:hypothetical protein KAF25_011200 [Fusarium avenaceum]